MEPTARCFHFSYIKIFRIKHSPFKKCSVCQMYPHVFFLFFLKKSSFGRRGSTMLPESLFVNGDWKVLHKKKVLRIFFTFLLFPQHPPPPPPPHTSYFIQMFPANLCVQIQLNSRVVSSLWPCLDVQLKRHLCSTLRTAALFPGLRVAAGTEEPQAVLWWVDLAGHRPCSTGPSSACPEALMFRSRTTWHSLKQQRLN